MLPRPELLTAIIISVLEPEKTFIITPFITLQEDQEMCRVYIFPRAHPPFRQLKMFMVLQLAPLFLLGESLSTIPELPAVTIIMYMTLPTLQQVPVRPLVFL